MTRTRLRPVSVCIALCALASAAQADYYGSGEKTFKRIATIANYVNNENLEDETVSEIVAATKNGKMLVYTDSPGEQVGFVWLGNDPANPVQTGTVALPGEPTSVETLGNDLALVAVNTSESFTETSGKLVVIRISKRKIIAEFELGGQPDSIKVSPDDRYAAIAIENERDEEICTAGPLAGQPAEEDSQEAEDCLTAGGTIGELPQTEYGNPAGFLAVVKMPTRNPKSWKIKNVELTGLAEYAPEDPEPEFVDINWRNQAVVTMQENNHIVIVDLRTRRILDHFTAGTVDLEQVDAIEDGQIVFSDSLGGLAREPDAVAWLNGGIATANEGDLFGGSRGFSIFGPNGYVVYDSGNSFEHLAGRIGHYPEDRSENKGSEPEGIAAAWYGFESLVFVGSERGSFVAVYDAPWWGEPTLKQVLPAPFGPEGLLPIPNRNLFVASGEEDDPEFGVRSTIMIYKYSEGPAVYPQIMSDTVDGLPITWGAMSGMDALPDGSLVAVSDSYYNNYRVFTIDPAQSPALITAALPLTGEWTGELDPEGIAVAPDGSYWIASEGNATDSRRNSLLHFDSTGALVEQYFLPAEIEACRQAERDLGDAGNTGTHGSGFEGVALVPRNNGNGYRLAVVQQRGWDYTSSAECEALDDDPSDTNPSQPLYTRVWLFNPDNGSWNSVPWELAPVPENASWAGLSEIKLTPDGDYIVIERDNRTGDFAELKTLVHVSRSAAADGVSADEKTVVDILAALESSQGWVTDKPEGTAIAPDGTLYLSTDNDGVEDWSGESWFLNLGNAGELFE